MVSSLFIKVPREKRELVKTIYDRAARELGDVPIVVANDGDVTALAGAMGLECGSVMGMAMGTSEAVGYVDRDGNVLGGSMSWPLRRWIWQRRPPETRGPVIPA